MPSLLLSPGCISFLPILYEEGEYLSLLRNVKLGLAGLAFRPGMDRFLCRGLQTCIVTASWMFQLAGRRVRRFVLTKALYNWLRDSEALGSIGEAFEGSRGGQRRTD